MNLKQISKIFGLSVLIFVTIIIYIWANVLIGKHWGCIHKCPQTRSQKDTLISYYVIMGITMGIFIIYLFFSLGKYADTFSKKGLAQPEIQMT